MNALKHGLDAQTLILPGEDDAAFRARLDAWRADFPPRNSQEDNLIEQAARLSWQLDRADRVLNASLAGRIALAGSAEARQEAEAEAEAEADRIGRQLIAGPFAAVFAVPGDDKVAVRRQVGTPIHPDDPTHPTRLLRHLESTAAGCRWLLDRWAGLRATLKSSDDTYWLPAERLGAVHLLGKQPVDAVDDPLVQRIYLCAFALDPNGPAVFADQTGTMQPGEFEYFLQRLAGRRVSELVPPDRESARKGLLALVEGVIAGLEARSVGHVARAERKAAADRGGLTFDDSPENRRMWRLQQRLLGSLLRTVDLLMKVRSHPKARAARPESTANVAASPGDPETCEEIRNEPNRSTPDVKPGSMSPVDESLVPGDSSLVPARAADADPAGIVDRTREVPRICVEIRNEPSTAIRGDGLPSEDAIGRDSNRASPLTSGPDPQKPGDPPLTHAPQARSGPPGRAGPDDAR